jgi:hypothetical protein
MILTQNPALAGYLKEWKGANPFRCLALVKISVLAVASGGGMFYVGNKFGLEFTFVFLGTISIMVGLIIGFSNALFLLETITSFHLVWNANILDELRKGFPDSDGMKRKILAPAILLAKEIIRMNNSGTDKLPIGARRKKNLQRRIRRYMMAVTPFTHGINRNDIKLVFRFAKE